MLSYSTHDLYYSILQRAAEEWDIEYDDLEGNIANRFDPIVRFLAGACASELEQVYKNLHETEGRLQERLTRILLPEYFHLPEPAHALATATPASQSVLLDESTTFMHETIGEKKEIAFSPPIPMRLLPASIRVIATENQLLNTERKLSISKDTSGATNNWVSKILIGIEATSSINSVQNASIYFDLLGRSEKESEKTRFFSALIKSHCFFGDEAIETTSGLPETALSMEDYLNGNERLQTQLRAHYERQFITFSGENNASVKPKSAQEFLQQWFAANLSAQETDKVLQRVDKNLNQQLYWIAIHLSQPVEVSQLLSRLSVRLNVFPIVNRRLCGIGNTEHHYFQRSVIEWIHLKPKENFLAMHRVYEEKPPNYQLFKFKPFAEFKEDKSPSYTLRHGGVGRWDDFNAWQRLGYIVSILQENYEHDVLIQKAAAALSLEDVHHLLGKKISETESLQKPATDIYLLLHTGATSGMRVRTEYWTSQGAAANGVTAKSAMKCTSKLSAYLDAGSLQLITATTGGRDPLTATEQLHAMKSTLVSRGRMVTREDVKAFCRDQLKERIEDVSVQPGVGVDPHFNYGLTRLLDIRIKPAQSARHEDWEAICASLQVLIENKSASVMPIRVQLQ